MLANRVNEGSNIKCQWEVGGFNQWGLVGFSQDRLFLAGCSQVSGAIQFQMPLVVGDVGE